MANIPGPNKKAENAKIGNAPPKKPQMKDLSTSVENAENVKGGIIINGRRIDS